MLSRLVLMLLVCVVAGHSQSWHFSKDTVHVMSVRGAIDSVFATSTSIDTHLVFDSISIIMPTLTCGVNNAYLSILSFSIGGNSYDYWSGSGWHPPAVIPTISPGATKTLYVRIDLSGLDRFPLGLCLDSLGRQFGTRDTSNMITAVLVFHTNLGQQSLIYHGLVFFYEPSRTVEPLPRGSSSGTSAISPKTYDALGRTVSEKPKKGSIDRLRYWHSIIDK